MTHVVLLGDSIFDNAAYVPGEPAVIDQLRARLGTGWRATLRAVDGDVTRDVLRQTGKLPRDASHLVISVGGNDALRQSDVLKQPASTVAEALQHLTVIRSDFQRQYRHMLQHLGQFNRPMTVCTVYDAIPGLEAVAVTALALFNEVILREAAAAKVAVIDLRLVCTDAADYSALSPIEPSAAGGAKIVDVIQRWLTNANLGRHSSVYA